MPATFSQGITQRKRWVAGFFQSLGAPLSQMGMPLGKRLRARMNFVPTLSLLVNPVGFVIGIWALVQALTTDNSFVSGPLLWLCIINIVAAVEGLLPKYHHFCRNQSELLSAGTPIMPYG